MKIFVLSIVLLLTSCFKMNHTKNTFVFDFDQTIWGRGDHDLLVEYFAQNKDKNYVKDRIKFHNDKIRIIAKKMGWIDGMNQASYASLIREIFLDKTLVKTLDDKAIKNFVDFILMNAREHLTEGMRDIFESIQKKGHKIIILGGAVDYCKIIPESLKDWNLDNITIYSGISYSAEEIKNGKMIPPFYYVNCKTGIGTEDFLNKSNVISFLKKNNETTGKIIMIGDGVNDLETLEAKASDVFIGFGLHRVDKKVEKNATVFVRNIDEFKKEIIKYL